MHLMATYLLFLIDYAYKTSEKVPSPFLEIRRYSKVKKYQLKRKFLGSNKNKQLFNDVWFLIKMFVISWPNLSLYLSFLFEYILVLNQFE